MLPSFLSHFSTSLEVFPGIPSQINYLHLNQHFKVSFWETPNQDAHPWFCLHLVATHPFTPSLLTFLENNHITKKFHFATNTENSKLKNQGLCFLGGSRNSWGTRSGRSSWQRSSCLSPPHPEVPGGCHSYWFFSSCWISFDAHRSTQRFYVTEKAACIANALPNHQTMHWLINIKHPRGLHSISTPVFHLGALHHQVFPCVFYMWKEAEGHKILN